MTARPEDTMALAGHSTRPHYADPRLHDGEPGTMPMLARCLANYDHELQCGHVDVGGDICHGPCGGIQQGAVVDLRPHNGHCDDRRAASAAGLC
jgi:hypothetical protein